MRHSPRLALFGLAVFALTIGAGSRAAAQTATPAAGGKAPGELAKAVREFNAASMRQPGTLDFQFQVAVFDTPEHAHAALAAAMAALRADPRIANLRLQPEAGLGDEATAGTGQISQGGVAFKLGLLFIRVGVVDHGWLAAGISGDPLADLRAIARRRFAAAGTPSAVTSPAAAGRGLLALLPTLADLPSPNFRLVGERTENALGTPTA